MNMNILVHCLMAMMPHLSIADRLEQADISFSRDGDILLIVTPIS